MSDLISKSEYGKALGVKIKTIRAKIGNCPNHFLAQSVINDWESEIEGLYDALRLLDKAHTIDAVEVVRCENCCYWVENKCCDTGSGYCDNPDGLVNNCCYSHDFCSYGERKEVSE